MKTLLHVGCGNNPIAPWLDTHAETRLDIDPDCSPHIVADMRFLPDGIGPFDLVYGSHVLEHIYPHEVVPTLEGFRRVLSENGAVIMFVPDLEGVKATEDVVFTSPTGPITGLDMIYGHHEMVRECLYMAHHCGFTAASLEDCLLKAGFSRVKIMQGTWLHELMGAAVK